MPCAIRPERLAVVLCGGSPAPDPDMARQTQEAVKRAGFRALPLGADDGTPAEPGSESADLGPLSGILAAVESCDGRSGSCLLAMPADMPNINPRALQRLADIAEAHGGGALFDLGPLPMALILSPGLRQTLVEGLQQPALRSLRGLAERLQLPVVASLPDDQLDNLSRRRRQAQSADPFSA